MTLLLCYLTVMGREDEVVEQGIDTDLNRSTYYFKLEERRK